MLVLEPEYPDAFINAEGETMDGPPGGWVNLLRAVDWPPVISAISAAVSALFAVLIWFVYKGQWRTMDEQAAYMRDGLSETRKAADAAAKSADAAYRALLLDGAVSMGIGDVRASLVQDPGETRVKVSYRIFNASKNPARVQHFKGIAAIDIESPAILEYDVNEIFTPGKGIHFPIQTKPLDAARLAEWHANGLVVHVHFAVTTTDPQSVTATHTFNRFVTCGPGRVQSRLLQGERERD